MNTEHLSQEELATYLYVHVNHQYTHGASHYNQRFNSYESYGPNPVCQMSGVGPFAECRTCAGVRYVSKQ